MYPQEAQDDKGLIMDLFWGNLWISTLKKLPKAAPKIAKRITMMAVKRACLLVPPRAVWVLMVPGTRALGHTLAILHLDIEGVAGMVVQGKARHKLAAIIVIEFKLCV